MKEHLIKITLNRKHLKIILRLLILMHNFIKSKCLWKTYNRKSKKLKKIKVRPNLVMLDEHNNLPEVKTLHNLEFDKKDNQG